MRPRASLLPPGVSFFVEGFRDRPQTLAALATVLPSVCGILLGLRLGERVVPRSDCETAALDTRPGLEALVRSRLTGHDFCEFNTGRDLEVKGFLADLI